MMIPTSFSSITGLLLNDVGGSSIGDETFMQAISKVFSLCSLFLFVSILPKQTWQSKPSVDTYKRSVKNPSWYRKVINQTNEELVQPLKLLCHLVKLISSQSIFQHKCIFSGLTGSADRAYKKLLSKEFKKFQV